MDKPFTYEQFKEIYSKVPRLCVDVVIVNQEGVILVLRKPGFGWDNQWHLPGGTLMYREKIEDAARRIAKKETGLEIKVEKILGFIELFSEERERGFGYSVSIPFLCSTIGGELKNDGDGTDIGIFRTLPEKVVIEHREFLERQNFMTK